MLRINVDRRSIDRIDDLVNFIDCIPSKIKMANSRAGYMSVKDIKDNVQKRGRPGRAVQVTYGAYGEFGMRLSISVGSARGGNTGGRSKTGRYSILIASRIFLNSEEGKVGRRAFILPYKPKEPYVVSHSSGEWTKGQFLIGPLRIPQIGPFYFSSQRGMKREKISTTSRNILKGHLNRYYDNALSRTVQ